MTTTKLLMQYADWALMAVCLVSLFGMARNGLLRQFPTLAGMLGLRVGAMALTIVILFHRKITGLDTHSAYKVFFYGSWTLSALLLVFEVATIYAVYRLVMKPLEGLQKIGVIIFRWVSSVSIVLSVAMAFGPHTGGSEYLATVLSRVEEGVSVLILCLLLFVCFAARPLGLTLRSRAFGITLSMGISACVSLVISAWFTSQQALSVYSPVYLVASIGSIISVSTLAMYVLMPEPARKMILLPTTSPYFLWNRISEALGDEPGVVAVAGFTPTMLASAELVAIKTIGMGARQPALAETSEMPMFQPMAASR